MAEQGEELFGVVITGEIDGEIIGAVFSNDNNEGENRIYLLTRPLVTCDRKQALKLGLSMSKIHKMEEPFKFGECFYFTANRLGVIEKITRGRGKQLGLYDPHFLNGKHYTLKVIGVVSQDGRLWTAQFGFVEVPERAILPLHNVPLECFIDCDYDLERPFEVKFSLHSYGVVARREVAAVQETPWYYKCANAGRPHAPAPLPYDDDDDDDSSDDGGHADPIPRYHDRHFVKVDEEYGDLVKTERNIFGVLFPGRIYSAQHPTTYFRLVFPHDIRKPGALHYGTLVRCDAYYSTIHAYWIVYKYDILRKPVDLRRQILNIPQPNPNKIELAFPTTTENGKMTFPADLLEVGMPGMPGIFENKQLAYVPDRRGVFSTLTPKLRSQDQRATLGMVDFLGANRIFQFETISISPSLLRGRRYEPVIRSLGYIVGREIICPSHVNVLFTIDFHHDVPPGFCVDFEAYYDPDQLERTAYTVTYFDKPPPGNGNYDLGITKVGGVDGIICSVYLYKAHYLGMYWSSPLFGPVEDVYSLMDTESMKTGRRVVILRDHTFKLACTMFYIHSLAPEPAEIQGACQEEKRIGDLIEPGLQS